MTDERSEDADRTLALTEKRTVPWDGVILGWGAMVPLALCTVAVWTGDAHLAAWARAAARGWGAALVFFFSGVRRGLSFRTEGGPTAAQLVVFALLFSVGLVVWLLPLSTGLALLVPTFAVLAVEDVRAARRGEAPLYFVRLRPWQMAFAAVCTALCWAAQ